jgi:hypothetical protein
MYSLFSFCKIFLLFYNKPFFTVKAVCIKDSSRICFFRIDVPMAIFFLKALLYKGFSAYALKINTQAGFSGI